MKKYNIGDLIILKNDYDHITYRGIILSLNECDRWWGGGFYDIFWSPSLTKEGNEKISYNQLVDWERRKEAVIHMIK